ncbi:helix-turn-helix domain-containing protein [Adlercreutzia sp. ZJ473]|uniref:helix-turn-helix domain-containing protein n=1 Tax=Adlercreutzia sp. ZJ473 TaxID=2722822 RepID=UPI001554C1E3|nr:helix-turn-helix domain-containing protein [Adlercreutzia sp. ZJ473]
MIYLNEFEFYEAEGMICAVPFDHDGATCGSSLDEAVFMATDWLRSEIEYALMRGETPRSGTFGHTPEHGGIVIAVSVDCDLARVDAVSAADAARLLGVSTARVSQMCESGQLTSWKEGARRRVLRASVEARLEERPQAGRPRKSALG